MDMVHWGKLSFASKGSHDRQSWAKNTAAIEKLLSTANSFRTVQGSSFRPDAEASDHDIKRPPDLRSENIMTRSKSL